MAEANKKEGNELFRDGNHAHAAERYLKALGHCSKMVDVTDAQKVQMAPLKETCHLNLAMCWFKLGKMEKCIENCKDCLLINSSNTKALLRRGLAYEQDKRCHLSLPSLPPSLPPRSFLERKPGQPSRRRKKIFF